MGKGYYWEAAERRRGLEERFEDVDFEEGILPTLHDFTLAELTEKTGLSASYLGEVRRGEKVPSLEHWTSLTHL